MTTTPDDDADGHAACRERLSALMDGELSGAPLHQACGHWREAAASRSTWHAYHVIGDVLRSDDLGGGAHRDALFLQGLRERLAGEPVVLAPQPSPQAGRAAPSHEVARHAWRAPLAMAAGVVAAVGVGWWSWAPFAADTASPAVAALAADPTAGRAARPLALVAPVGVRTGEASSPTRDAAEPVAVAPGDPLIRDARLDRYLAAHQQFAGSSALGVPSGFLRAATAEPAGR